MQFRREVQRVDLSTQISELKCFGMNTLDRPLCLWRFVLPVVEGNEESSRRNYTSMGRRSPSRSVVTMTVRHVIRWPSQFLSPMTLLLETTKQVVTIDTNLPIVRPRTITRRKIRAKRSTWICKQVWVSFLHICLFLPSGFFDWSILPLNFNGCNLPWSQLADFSM